jgi:pimeloyl-ACP methyl ester carboxylesterase
MRTREYGHAGRVLILLHGGPGVSGYLAPLARRLGEMFRVLEPMQRGSGEVPLTVARHVQDLAELIHARCARTRPALVGHSWGAMLALAYAAAHPSDVGALALIGCGTFDPVARGRLQATIDERLRGEPRRRIDRVRAEIADPDERLKTIGELLLPAYSYDLASITQPVETCDARAHEETWEDMVRLQDAGVYPAAFAAIEVPVLMLHGAADPHPGRLIRAGLEPYLPQLAYREWAHCGHYPWLERAVAEEFMTTLSQWLLER